MAGTEALIGESVAIREVMQRVESIARYDEPVLIVGESGVGKNLIAKAVHEHSTRAARPAVWLNCGALSESTLMSELFGHVRGGFTGAQTNRTGLLVSADRSTMVLDEITETSPTFQASLLRAVENGEVRPVGSDSVRRVDVRFVATTNRLDSALVHGGGFRFDLFQRLGSFIIEVPPLRRRPEDTLALADHFLSELSAEYGAERRLASSAQKLLTALPLRGNARELRNILLRVHATTRGDLIRRRHIEGVLWSGWSAEATSDSGPVKSWNDSVRDHLCAAVEASGGNLSRAARMLDLPRGTLRHYLDKYEVSSRPAVNADSP